MPCLPPSVDVAIIGGGYAGVIAATRLTLGGATVCLVDPKPHFVDRVRLHDHAAGRASAFLPWSRVLSPGVHRVQGRVAALRAGSLEIWTPQDTVSIDAAHVLLATGSTSRSLFEGPQVLHLDQPQAMRERLRRRPDAPVSVIGGGTTGIEVATALASTGRPVTLVVPPEHRLLGLGAADAHWLDSHLDRLGVSVVRDTIQHIDEHGIHGLHSTPTELVLPCTGFQASGAARALGLPTQDRGQVAVLPTLAVLGHPNLWAAGDAAAVPTMPWLHMSCAAALPMGAHAAANILATLRGDRAQPLSLALPVRCTALGPRTALVQQMGAGGPEGWCLRGLGAAVIKAGIVAMVSRMSRWEAQAGRPLYRWAQGPVRAALDATPRQALALQSVPEAGAHP